MASKSLPFVTRRQVHPMIRLGAATAGSLAVIVAGWMFLSETVSHAATQAPLPRTERQVWYVPATQPTSTAAQLDIARSVPVTAELPPTVTAGPGIYTHQVGVEALKVRSGPARGSNQVLTLSGGTAVSLGETSNGWVQIITEDGRQGWVFAKFLNPRQG